MTEQDKNKIETLIKLNPKLSRQDACLLLGIKYKIEKDMTVENLKNIFNMKD